MSKYIIAVACYGPPLVGTRVEGQNNASAGETNPLRSHLATLFEKKKDGSFAPWKQRHLATRKGWSPVPSETQACLNVGRLLRKTDSATSECTSSPSRDGV